MLIDSHVHIFPFGLINQDFENWFKNKKSKVDQEFGVEQLINEMDLNNVDMSIVLPLFKNNKFKEINDYLGNIQKLNPDRLICFAGINPKNIKSSIAELKRIKFELNLKGIKLHPTLQKFYPNNKKYFEIYKLAEDLELPILFHSGFGGFTKLTDKYSEPIFLDEVACKFNKLKIIIGHGGRSFYNQTAMLLRKHKNIYTEVSTNLPKLYSNGETNKILLFELLKNIKILCGNLDKVFFGSDYPFRGIRETIKLLEDIKDIKSCILPDEIDNILNDNLMDCLGKNLGIKK